METANESPFEFADDFRVKLEVIIAKMTSDGVEEMNVEGEEFVVVRNGSSAHAAKSVLNLLSPIETKEGLFLVYLK